MFSNFDPILSGNPVVKLEMSNSEAQYIQLYPFQPKIQSLDKYHKKMFEYSMLQVNLNLYSIYTPMVAITFGSFLIAR